MDRCAFIHLTGDPDVSSMGFDDILNQRKSEPWTLDDLIDLIVNTIEFVKQFWNVPFIDPDPSIAYLYF